ncbi:Yip1 family protein [Streptomyces sp. TRM 70351]|uniref:Yip1 family protein n=1 Tax=Streptomyces sp. TRM 70351 TaxID=3116552 RepID=UPI002E7B0D63|nr:Yip1 family protein [Streptomyces sp. TRM 70351]MEE1929907.1 Yip1 family protein [Streptomyces sp. TRM 70351]
MAGFRIGRGRGPRNAQQGQQPPVPQGPPQQPPHGQHHPGQAPGPYGGQQPVSWGQGQGGSPHGAGHGSPHGEPEYFDGHAVRDPYADAPGHTRQFSIHEEPGGGDDYTSGSTYAAGRTSAPPAGPRLPWKELLAGIVLRPKTTFWQTRDHAVWGPAVLVTFLYGLLAVFGLDQAREEVLNSTLTSAVPYVLITGVAVVISMVVLGSVTHTLARQFGGDGAWAPTVGLAMLISSLTDAPRLLFAFFLGGNAPFVQVLGWLTWVAAGALFALMVSRSHDLPWPKALGASAIQLVALLFLIKLGTL